MKDLFCKKKDCENWRKKIVSKVSMIFRKKIKLYCAFNARMRGKTLQLFVIKLLKTYPIDCWKYHFTPAYCTVYSTEMRKSNRKENWKFVSTLSTLSHIMKYVCFLSFFSHSINLYIQFALCKVRLVNWCKLIRHLFLVRLVPPYRKGHS